MASLDELTEIANRRHFNKSLQQAWQLCLDQTIPLSLILCDIDYFKSYNDHYGHLAGDHCLKQVAKAINQVVRLSTDLVARYGGEEFVAILPQTNLQGAVQVAQRIQQKVQDLKIIHAFSSISEQITLSLGISTRIPTRQSSPLVLIHDSDKALYEAKKRGRNRYCVCGTPQEVHNLALYIYQEDQAIIHQEGEKM